MWGRRRTGLTDHFTLTVSSQFQDTAENVKPDLILIYRKPDATTLELVRLGSHSELGI
jgi:mRNA-degrading endonuclease YafQ of YafQ-DinJ toxin-antitoxin module